ncbi:MAG: type VI secretion system ATPase TssH [Proteobacteria bacterium]|nr:MAG: type VI secretion system ATPase TssH [Pseudomonadota bacterium]
MGEISRVALFSKLNPLAYRAIEAATVFCKLRGNPYVELPHWFHQILQLQDSDLHHLVREFELDQGRVAKELMIALEELPRGAASIVDLSAHLEDAVERGWVYGSLMFGASRVRTGHLVVGMLKSRSLRNVLFRMSREFERIDLPRLTDHFGELLEGSPEAAFVAPGDEMTSAQPGEASGAMAPPQLGKKEALQRFTTDLTAKARAKEIDPIVGRDVEIRQIGDILMRRRQNNPIITGEAGVGKTAVVEGFALRIAAGDVPPALRDVELRSLDIGLMQAGASMKGEFENRLRQLIEEVQSSEKPIILFIDEAHTLIGAGGAAGTGDAANLLKPALARGTLRTIAATTWAEYKKHIEKDPALTRRFQVIQVNQPSEDKALLMMRGIVATLQEHHQVEVLDEALEAAVSLSHRYIPGRQLPDKAVSLLDTSCARTAISQHATPAKVEDSQRRIEALETELQIIDREAAVGVDTGDRGESAKTRLKEEQRRLSALEEAWVKEKELVKELLERQEALRTELSEEERSSTLEELEELQRRLGEVQGESPLILPCVDRQAVASVVEDWTGVPVGRMVKDEVETVLNLSEALGKRVIGQSHAHEMIARRIQTSRAGLSNPQKPIGVFMLAGPSGVGKTETALALAESLYGGEQNLITINMSEFQEAHTVSTLKGAPPGYVGYGEGGVLTEAVRRRPHSVVLLDEVEKAHSDVHEIFFQVFDKGWMEDGEGRKIDFRNTLILLTSNVGSQLIMDMCADPELMPEPEGVSDALRAPMLKTFPAALLGRLVVIPYYPLTDEVLGVITRMQLERIVTRVEQNHGTELCFDEEVIKLITARCTELESGGRMIDGIITNTLLPQISREVLHGIMRGSPIRRVSISAADGEFRYAFN